MPEKCEHCTEHSVRITKLETDSEWMKGALDEIRMHTKEVAGYAQQLVLVAHETATMSAAVTRAFDEIESERAERKMEIRELREDIAPLVKQWDGVLETSKWVKTGMVALVGLVLVAVISLVVAV